MSVVGVKGRDENILEALFQKIVSLVNDEDRTIVWLEDTGTIPFQSLASRLITPEKLNQIQYVRVFDLEGYIDTLNEIREDKCVLVLSHFGSMCKDRVYHDEIAKGNTLVNEIMLQLRRLAYKNDVDSFIVGVDGLVGYYLDDVLCV